jgi:hypothetical protein
MSMSLCHQLCLVQASTRSITKSSGVHVTSAPQHLLEAARVKQCSRATTVKANNSLIKPRTI